MYICYLILLSLHHNPAREPLSSHLTDGEGWGWLSHLLEVTQLMVKSRVGNSSLSLLWQALKSFWLLSYSVFMVPQHRIRVTNRNHGQEWVALPVHVCRRGAGRNHGFVRSPRAVSQGVGRQVGLTACPWTPDVYSFTGRAPPPPGTASLRCCQVLGLEEVPKASVMAPICHPLGITLLISSGDAASWL